MRIVPGLLAVIALVLLAPPAARAGEGVAGEASGESASSDESFFVAGFEALPLMPGLKNVSGSGVEFDTPSGRIVEAVAEGPVAGDEVLAFYGRTLPQLGWERSDGNEFRREGEVLKLELSDGGTAGDQEGNRVTVRFFLSPN